MATIKHYDFVLSCDVISDPEVNEVVFFSIIFRFLKQPLNFVNSSGSYKDQGGRVKNNSPQPGVLWKYTSQAQVNSNTFRIGLSMPANRATLIV